MGVDDLVMQGARASSSPIVLTWLSQKILVSAPQVYSEFPYRQKEDPFTEVWTQLLNQSERFSLKFIDSQLMPCNVGT